MKKIFSAIIAIAAMCGLNSCGDSTNEIHQTYFYPLTATGVEMYADQQVDSVRLISYDSWTLDVMEGSWLTVSPTKLDIPVGMFANQRIMFTATPNTTGQTRGALLRVTSWATISMPVAQYPFLHITKPLRRAQGDGTSTGVTTVVFEETVAASAETATARLTTYSPGATVTSSAEWLTVADDDQQLATGAHELTFSLQPNTSSESRTAIVTVTSAGVSTPITYIQEGKKD